MESKNKIKQIAWLNLLKEAIEEGVEIQVNHRYKYKNKNLGTFLVSSKKKNDIELTKKIKSLGFDYKKHSHVPEHYLEKFILELSKKKKPNRQLYITRFNSSVLPKKELLKEETIHKLNLVWKKKFGDERKWEKPETEIDKIRKWKEFRYDKEVNPKEKWFDYRKNMGKLYGWVYVRKRNQQKMNAIINHFNEEQRIELKKEGFLS